MSSIVGVCLGKAVEKIDPSATAYFPRQAKWWILVMAHWDKPEDRAAAVEWTRSVGAMLKPYVVSEYARYA